MDQGEFWLKFLDGVGDDFVEIFSVGDGDVEVVDRVGADFVKV